MPLSPLNGSRRRVARRVILYGAGDSFSAMYVVRKGTFKSFTRLCDGSAQVTGFQIAGDVIGLDGIETGHHLCNVVALQDAEVLAIPRATFEEWSDKSAHGQGLMLRTLGHEIAHNHEVTILLTSKGAERKFVLFLLDLSERYGRLGESRSLLRLGMSRRDIASYLAIEPETVSRVFASLQRDGLVRVQGRLIRLLNISALRRLSGSPSDRWRSAELTLDQDVEVLVP